MWYHLVEEVREKFTCSLCEKEKDEVCINLCKLGAGRHPYVEMCYDCFYKIGSYLENAMIEVEKREKEELERTGYNAD